MRKRRAVVLSLTFLGLAAFGTYAAWAFYAAAEVGYGWTGLRSAWPYLFAGALTVGVVIAAFVWLAFFSERRGYDDRAGLDHH